MKRNQRGEVMVAAMAVMLVVAWLGRGHMNSMGTGHVAEHLPRAVDAEQAASVQGPAASVPARPAEHGH